MSIKSNRFTFPRIRLGKVIVPSYRQWLFLLFTLNCLILQSQLVNIAWHGGHADFVFIGGTLGALSMAALLHLSPNTQAGWITLLATALCTACMGWVLTNAFHSMLIEYPQTLYVSLNDFSPDTVMGRILLPFSPDRTLVSHTHPLVVESFVLIVGLFWSAFLLIGWLYVTFRLRILLRIPIIREQMPMGICRDWTPIFHTLMARIRRALWLAAVLPASCAVTAHRV